MKQTVTAVLSIVFFVCILFTVSAQTEAPRQSKAASSQNSVIRYYEQLIGSMTQQLKLLQDQNAVLESKVVELENKLNKSQSQVDDLKQEVSSLNNALKKESEARDAQMKKIIQSIEKIAKIPPASPQPNKTNPQLAPLEFEEYIVQAGATLSAIAQAYGVTVQDIKRANNLKSDNIRVGQKLLIPVK